MRCSGRDTAHNKSVNMEDLNCLNKREIRIGQRVSSSEQIGSTSRKVCIIRLVGGDRVTEHLLNQELFDSEQKRLVQFDNEIPPFGESS